MYSGTMITLLPLQPRDKSPTMDDDPNMFSLDGFDDGETLLDEPDGVAIATGGGVAFPQSDDEEISTDTDGELAQYYKL